MRKSQTLAQRKTLIVKPIQKSKTGENRKKDAKGAVARKGKIRGEPSDIFWESSDRG